MCQGQPAAARSMNFEGLRRRGWMPERISGIKAIHKALYRDDLTLDQAKARIAEMPAAQPATSPDVAMMLSFLENTSAQRGIVR
jgi:UDP-N-acetylglucosamine acyltransferase